VFEFEYLIYGTISIGDLVFICHPRCHPESGDFGLGI